MTDAQNSRPGVAFWSTVLAVVVLVPPAMYLGAYAWIVEPTPVVILPSMGGERHFTVPKYDRLGGALFWRTFFRPANQLDRCVRPDVWQD
jgi:hypothetical protein